MIGANVGEVGVASDPPLSAFVFEVPNDFLLLRVNGYHRPSGGQCPAYLLIDVSKLSVPIRMLVTLFRLSMALQAVVHLPQELCDLFVADRMALRNKFCRKRTRTLAAPTQRRIRVATRQWFNQGFQAPPQVGIERPKYRASSSRPSPTTRAQRRSIKLLDVLRDSHAGHATDSADLKNAPIAHLLSFSSPHHTVMRNKTR